jgi:hypothetical protein
MKDITAIIPIAPMPSHPSTEVLDQTIASIRERLPDSEIILMFDAPSPTTEELRPGYMQYLEAMLWKAEHDLDNVTPIVFDTHHHQSLMLKHAMHFVRTPMILWAEQDTPLHNEIPFDELAEVVTTGYANLIRFHHEASVHPEHQYLMLDREPIDILGQPFIRTRQWSGRPHLASTKFYNDIIAKYWTDKPEFIEHRMYGVVVDGDYDEFRLHLYAPQETQVRSIHLDGRRRGAKDYDPRPS